MGRVKQLFNEYWEEKLAQAEANDNQLKLDLAQDAMDMDSEEWAVYTKEFNEWLDAYEKSFGDKDGRLP